MEYRLIVGLEIHAELKTNTKIFCSCSTKFTRNENINCCPICLGMPGTLPTLNKKVVEYAIKAGIGLNSKIQENSTMDRKNYFYPDLTKAYQITQLYKPLCIGGYIELENKKINLKRIHIEEDAGKTTYVKDVRKLNYNRSGIPLIEIVTEPEITNAQEAVLFLEKLKAILKSLDICDCKMEEGSIRCDVNINIESRNKKSVSNIVEIKNLNSFKAVQRSILYEEKRHKELLAKNHNTLKETRQWDESNNVTRSMRKKEDSQDYRYFPEPDILNIEVKKELIEEIRKSIGELPTDKIRRFKKDYGLSDDKIDKLIKDREYSSFFERIGAVNNNYNKIANFIIEIMIPVLKENKKGIEDISANEKHISTLLELNYNNIINSNELKNAFIYMCSSENNPDEIIKKLSKSKFIDEEELLKEVKRILEENKKIVEDYKAGKEKVVGYLMGCVMKEFKSKVNPKSAKNTIINELRKN